MKQLRWLAAMSLLLAGVLAVGGCGGGGDGDDDDGGGGSQRVQITDANAPDVTFGAMDAVSTMVDVSGFGEMLVEILINFDVQSRTAARSAAILVPGVCSTGTVDVAITDVTPMDVFSLGDSAVFTFSSCEIPGDFGADIFNGAVTVSVANITAQSVSFPDPPFEVTFAFTFSGLTVTSDTTTTVSGGFSLTLGSQDGITYTAEMTGTTFGLSEPDWWATLTNFFLFSTSNEDNGDYTADASGTIASSEFGGGFVDFETTTTWEGTDPDNPDQGVLVITGAADSTITVTVEDSTMLEVSLDKDGNGEPDDGYPITIFWDDLDL